MEEETKSAKSTFVRKKKLQTMLERVTQEMYQRNFELDSTNKTLSLLRKIDELALESHDSLEAFSNQLAASIAATNEYPFVGLLIRPPARKTSLKIYGVSASVPISEAQRESFKRIEVKDSHPWFSAEQKSLLLETKNIRHGQLKQVLNDDSHEIDKLRKSLDIQTLLLVKLMAREKVVGLMAVGFVQSLAQVTDNERQLFERLSEAVGVALDNKLLFEENQLVLKQLQKTNDKLRALDEAKDEFISMASHQLRTPLTSVKGYLSMVLEGDAGKLEPTQIKLLGQAFVSSQRMVYLIADLLNVSRLRTGKFVIESSPTNLANVVESEIGQLTETAQGRHLTLSYKKPAKFPTLMLDETKIRQVIMNFMDNAIYYTPSGGHIKINLVDKAQSIEFTVVDDGIGVPREEQHHLFTKFYRAGNAKKARPDGTGLGLFMAQKVIVAQGGSIIFHTAEGKGSTFGFTFAKSRLHPPQIPKPLTSTELAGSAKLK